MKIVINPKYQQLETFLRALPTTFETQGEVLQDERNLIKTIRVGEYLLNVKRYKIPIFINRIVYAYFRPTKASRAYNNALEVAKRGFETPEAVAYIEDRKWGLIGYTYFVSIQLEGMKEFREHCYTIKGHEEELLAFAQYSGRLHDAGILHKDYSSGNILYKKENGNYLFALVDINRMTFCDIDMETGCESFCRLFKEDSIVEFVAQEYALARGFFRADCFGLMLEYKHLHWKKAEKKKRLKQRLGRK